jgi:hypothetical protein
MQKIGAPARNLRLHCRLSGMDDDGDLVEQAAREAIDQYGDGAVSVLRERAEVADHLGDLLAAEAWRDIADATEGMLRT